MSPSGAQWKDKHCELVVGLGKQCAGQDQGQASHLPWRTRNINHFLFERHLISYHQMLLQICPGESACKALAHG